VGIFDGSRKTERGAVCKFEHKSLEFKKERNMQKERKRAIVENVFLALAILGPPHFCLSQSRTISAKIDVSKTGAPISKNIYSQKVSLGDLPESIAARPFSVNIYSYPVQ